MTWITLAYSSASVATYLYLNLNLKAGIISCVFLGVLWPATWIFLLGCYVMFDAFLSMIPGSKK